MLTSLTKKTLLAFALTTLVVGSAALAGDTKSPSTVRGNSQHGRPYTSYSGKQTMEMLDAINRDHPVPSRGRAMDPSYASYKKDRESTTIVDAINHNSPVLISHYSMDPSLSSYKDQKSEDLFEALGDR